MKLFNFLKKKNKGIESSEFNSQKFQDASLMETQREQP